MRFLGDMGVSGQTLRWLREHGHDAVHLRDQGLQRLRDPELLEKARQEQRILLTMDLGFGALVAASGGQLPSVVVFRLEDERPERVTARLAVVLSRFSEELASGAILPVSERTIRVRALPLR